MKFKLFGGLDCPDTLLAQLSVLGNTDIVTTKALTTLADHVVGVALLSVSSAPSSLGDACVAGSSNASSSSAESSVEHEVKAMTLKLFSDALKPLLSSSSSTGGGSDRLDGFSAKAVAFHENQRLQRAKAAHAAAKKFVVTATADELESLSVQPATIQQQLAIAEDALSQALVALDHIVANIARYGISDDVLMTELTMLGMAPEAVEAIKGTIKAAIGGFRDRSGENDDAAASSALKAKLAFIFGSGGDASGDESSSTAAVLRQLGLVKCPRVGGVSPIGAITPYTRTSVLSTLQQVVVKEGEEVDTVLTDDEKALAEAVLLNTNEDAAQLATTTAIIKISTTAAAGGTSGAARQKTIELTHAQARTLLNELIIARSIMRGDGEEGAADQ